MHEPEWSEMKLHARTWNPWMNEFVNEWMDECINEWMQGWMHTIKGNAMKFTEINNTKWNFMKWDSWTNDSRNEWINEWISEATRSDVKWHHMGCTRMKRHAIQLHELHGN
jgi:hypothetical protein